MLDGNDARLRVPQELANKLTVMAKRKDRLKEWSVEAREILYKAVRDFEAAETAGGETA